MQTEVGIRRPAPFEDASEPGSVRPTTVRSAAHGVDPSTKAEAERRRGHGPRSRPCGSERVALRRGSGQGMSRGEGDLVGDNPGCRQWVCRWWSEGVNGARANVSGTCEETARDGGGSVEGSFKLDSRGRKEDGGDSRSTGTRANGRRSPKMSRPLRWLRLRMARRGTTYPRRGSSDEPATWSQV